VCYNESSYAEADAEVFLRRVKMILLKEMDVEEVKWRKSRGFGEWPWWNEEDDQKMEFR
jgi:hypothetical protein